MLFSLFRFIHYQYCVLLTCIIPTTRVIGLLGRNMFSNSVFPVVSKGGEAEDRVAHDARPKLIICVTFGTSIWLWCSSCYLVRHTSLSLAHSCMIFRNFWILLPVTCVSSTLHSQDTETMTDHTRRLSNRGKHSKLQSPRLTNERYLLAYSYQH